MNNKEKGILRFEEEKGIFINSPKDVEKGAPINVSEPYLSVYDGDRKVAQIRTTGNVIYGELQSNLTLYCVTFTPEQRKEVDRKADEFQRKCDVDNVVAECEAAIVKMLTTFPMVVDPPIEAPVGFTTDNDGDVQINKAEYVIGIMRTAGVERGKLLLLYHIAHTSLTETDKLSIIEKCKAIMAASL